MYSFYFNIKIARLTSLSIFFIFINEIKSQTVVTSTFNAVGANTITSTYNYTVPPCVTTISISAWGGGGAGAGYDGTVGATGGGGAYAFASVSVTPGSVLTVIVGKGGLPGINGAGIGGGIGGAGFGFGGNGGNPGVLGTSGGGGGGGGGSGVSTATSTLVVASGGGGGGGSGWIGLPGRGGGGGQSGFTPTTTIGAFLGGATGTSPVINGVNGANFTGNDGAGGGGGGGGLNGGNRGGVQNNVGDRSAGGGGGGASFGTTIMNGNLTVPGNALSPLLCPSCAIGGVGGIWSATTPTNATPGGSGIVLISYMTATPLTISNSGPFCQGATIQLNSPSAVSYTWSGPNGFTSNLQNPNITNAQVVNAGVYTVTQTDISGCVNTATTNVIVNPSPSPIAGSNSPICAGGTLSLTSSGATTYTWSGPGAFTSTNQNPVITNISSTVVGVYTVTVSNAQGCVNTATVNVTVSTPIGSATNSGPYCVGATISLATPVATTYTWSGPGTFTSNVQNPTIASSAVTMAGTYTVTTTVGGCISTATTLVVVNPPPTIVIGSNNPVCAGGTLSLTSSGATTYTWSGPGAFTSTNQNPLITNVSSTAAGVYTVTGSNAPGCVSSATVNVTVTTPTTTATNAGPYCAGATISLTTPVATSYTWSGPGTFTSNVQNPSIASSAVTMAGTYTVSSNVAGCISTATTLVVVNPLPTIVTGSASTLNCTNLTSTLVANTSGHTLVWNGGALVNAPNPQTVSLPGNYTVTATNTISSCTSQSVVTVSQNTTQPIINASASNSLNCNLTSAVLKATSSINGLNYQWINGPASSTYAVSSASNYTVIATNPTNGCSSQAIVSVSQFTTALIITASTSNHLDCNNISAVLTASSTTNGLNYQWTGGPSSATYSVSLPLTYTVTATDPSNGCIGSAVVSVSAVALFTANVAVLSQINCFGYNSGALSITSVGGTVPFSITNLNTSNTINNINTFPVTLNNLSAGNYSIEVTDANGCKQIFYSNITQPAQLNVSVVGNSVLCAGNSANLSSSVFGGTAPYNFNWTPVGGTNPNITVTPNVNTTYTLIVTDNNGCSSSANIAIIVSPMPNASLINNGLVGCAPVCASFKLSQAQVSGYSYNWSFSSSVPKPTNVVSNKYNPDLCFSSPGIYNASILISTPQGCSTTVNYNDLVTVYAKPLADFYFTPDAPNILDAPEVKFINQSVGADSYQWYNVNGMFSTQIHSNYIYQNAGTFLVMLIASNPQCSDTISKRITIEDEFLLYVPNSFTPNDDNVNDTFYPVMLGPAPKAYSLMIFDRWGELIYKSDNPDETQWNGFHKNQRCKNDSYVWMLSYTSHKGKAKQLTGHIILMK